MAGERRARVVGFARRQVHRYQFINKNLLNNTYEDGDVYDQTRLEQLRAEWDNHPSSSKPYLRHVKFLANAWPHLRMLSDFMEVSTAPQRWTRMFQASPQQSAEEQHRRDEDRKQRWRRIKVGRLDYRASEDVGHKPYEDEDAEALRDDLRAATPTNVQLRLWVVEDLSRDVIELFGSTYDIEPAFFREHILDYQWHNVRDYWRDPPNLDVVARGQHWMQVRFVRARYFPKVKDFKDAFNEALGFNVLRRPDDDENNRTFWDRHEAKIGLMRSRASMWLRRPSKPGDAALGVLLLDPTLTHGIPLWRGYRNFEDAPSLSSYNPAAGAPPGLPTSPDQEPRSFFEDFLYWAQKPEVFTGLAAHETRPAAAAAAAAGTPPPSHLHVPIQALLHLICAEWLTMADYIKTRLTQIDWEIAYPETFLRHGSHSVKIDISLKKLHIWRRYVPIFREMISETLERVFRFPCHTPTILSRATGGGPDNAEGPGPTPLPPGIPPAAPPLTARVLRLAATEEQVQAADAAAAEHPATPPMVEQSGQQQQPGQQQQQQTPPPTLHHHRPIPGAIKAYEKDFALALGYMEEYQQRIDRLTSVVTAVMSLADSRRALADNRNIGRLTWLATIFVPFSLVAATFSMQANVTDISGETVRWFFAVALPVAFATLGLAIVLAHERVQKALGLGDRLRGWYGV